MEKAKLCQKALLPHFSQLFASNSWKPFLMAEGPVLPSKSNPHRQATESPEKGHTGCDTEPWELWEASQLQEHLGEAAAESSWILQPETPQDRSFLRSGIWKTLTLFTFPSNDLQDLAPRLNSPLDFISPPERDVKWVQEMLFILNMVLFPHLLREFSTQTSVVSVNMFSLLNLME